jgi:2-C-methyl-D-erythritol 4-phosphate cytidylyltransferase
LAPATLRERVIGGLQAGSRVVMPALAVTDSVKAVDAWGSVTDTLDRSTLRAVQYPRGFAADQLSQLLAGRTSDDFDELDESLRTGTAITLVDGDSDAFAVELPRDAAFVEAILTCRPGAG